MGLRDAQTRASKECPRHTKCTTPASSAARQQDATRDALVGKGYSRTSHLVPHFHYDFRFGLGDPNTWLSADLRTARDEGFLSEAERIGLMRGDIEALDETA